MKPSPKEEGRRWLEQAEHVLGVAKTLIAEACFAETCFHAEQAGQLALKAFLFVQGERLVRLHAVRELVEACAVRDATFRKLTDAAKVLDQYYIPTRYPDALAFPGLPYKTYTEQQAKEAVELAAAIVQFVKQKVGA